VWVAKALSISWGQFVPAMMESQSELRNTCKSDAPLIRMALNRTAMSLAFELWDMKIVDMIPES
jgi:hypothetical protein